MGWCSNQLSYTGQDTTFSFFYRFICWWHLDCVHFLATVSNATINAHLQFLCRYRSSILLAAQRGVALLGYMATLHLTVWETCKLSKCCSILQPNGNVWGFQFLHILLSTCSYFLFYFNQARECEVVSCRGLIGTSLTPIMLNIFKCLVFICLFFVFFPLWAFHHFFFIETQPIQKELCECVQVRFLLLLLHFNSFFHHPFIPLNTFRA